MTIRRQPRTPAEDVAQRLSVPLACGYKGCSKIFGVQPFPLGTAVAEFDHMLLAHFHAAHGTYRRKIKEQHV